MEGLRIAREILFGSIQYMPRMPVIEVMHNSHNIDNTPTRSFFLLQSMAATSGTGAEVPSSFSWLGGAVDTLEVVVAAGPSTSSAQGPPLQRTVVRVTLHGQATKTPAVVILPCHPNTVLIGNHSDAINAISKCMNCFPQVTKPSATMEYDHDSGDESDGSSPESSSSTDSDPTPGRKPKIIQSTPSDCHCRLATEGTLAGTDVTSAMAAAVLGAGTGTEGGRTYIVVSNRSSGTKNNIATTELAFSFTSPLRGHALNLPLFNMHLPGSSGALFDSMYDGQVKHSHSVYTFSSERDAGGKHPDEMLKNMKL
jgi:hypothetical protein